MIFTDREKARKAGIKRYMPKDKCPKGHLSEKLVSNDQCCECRKEYRVKSRQPKRKNKTQQKQYTVEGLPLNLQGFFLSLLNIDSRLPEIKAWLELRWILKESLGDIAGEEEFEKNVNKYLLHGGIGFWKFKWETLSNNYTYGFKNGICEKDVVHKKRSYKRKKYERRDRTYDRDDYYSKNNQKKNNDEKKSQNYPHTKPYLVILGFTSNCSPDKNELKKAYKKLSLKHHPDRGGCSEKFKILKQAYSSALLTI